MRQTVKRYKILTPVKERALNAALKWHSTPHSYNTTKERCACCKAMTSLKRALTILAKTQR